MASRVHGHRLGHAARAPRPGVQPDDLHASGSRAVRPSRSAASTANRANSSSAYQRSAPVRATTAPVRGAGVRELSSAAAVPEAERALQPDRRLADAERGRSPGAPRRRRTPAAPPARTAAPGHGRSRARVSATTGPSQRPAGRAAERLAPGPPAAAPTAAAAPPAGLLGQPAPARPRPRTARTPGADGAVGPAGQRPHRRGSASRTGTCRRRRCRAAWRTAPRASAAPPPVDRHPQQRRRHGAAAAPATGAA